MARIVDNIKSIPARVEIALRPEERFGPEDRMDAAEIQELENFLSNETLIKKLKSDTKIDATLLILLQAIVDKQDLASADKAALNDKLKAIKDFKAPVSIEEQEETIKQFQEEAIKAYQQIASTTISIIEGELSALTTGVPGAFSFEADSLKEMKQEEIQLFGWKSEKKETQKYLEAYLQQLDDVKAALDFMQKEIALVKKVIVKSEDKIKEILDIDSPFQMTGEVANLLKATTNYIAILADEEYILESITHFSDAHSGLKSVIASGDFNKADTESRKWGSDTIMGMATFAKFACRLSQAEGDLNKINQVDGAGVVRRGLSRAFSDIIMLDQKFYPMNNQIPIPSVMVAPVVINTYLEAYEERAVQMATATEKQLNQINNKFDRKIANAERNINQLSETLLMPKPAARSSIPKVIQTTRPTPPAPPETRPAPSPEELAESLTIIDNMVKQNPVNEMGPVASEAERLQRQEYTQFEHDANRVRYYNETGKGLPIEFARYLIKKYESPSWMYPFKVEILAPEANSIREELGYPLK